MRLVKMKITQIDEEFRQQANIYDNAIKNCDCGATYPKQVQVSHYVPPYSMSGDRHEFVVECFNCLFHIQSVEAASEHIFYNIEDCVADWNERHV